MSGLIATLNRELRAYFVSPLAYVILGFFLSLNGYVFAVIVSFLSDPRAGGSTTPLELFFGDTFFFWLVLMIMVPLVTMRLLAEERRSGTIEILMTAPVSEAQVVVGKFLAAFGFYVFLWLPTLAYVVIVARGSEVDWVTLPVVNSTRRRVDRPYLPVPSINSPLSKIKPWQKASIRWG